MVEAEELLKALDAGVEEPLLDAGQSAVGNRVPFLGRQLLDRAEAQAEGLPTLAEEGGDGRGAGGRFAGHGGIIERVARERQKLLLDGITSCVYLSRWSTSARWRGE